MKGVGYLTRISFWLNSLYFILDFQLIRNISIEDPFFYKVVGKADDANVKLLII